MIFENAVTFVHRILRDVIPQRSVVIDATMGNGWDTALMAGLVGEGGIVYGFDIQQVALEVTSTRISETSADVRLLLCSHEEMALHIEPEHHGKVCAVTFNLGYLPGGDKDVTTHAETTRRAIEAARTLLAPGGVITIVCYRHAEGQKELETIRSLLATWPQDATACTETMFLNQVGNPPVVFVVVARS
ncbi:MAG: class I SAM-dependent methyltransferase [Candidatus Kapabacteria bacterium]|nr:class I SAM-dependent methyltransferase [Candidatus Kapabacteria bacterium]